MQITSSNGNYAVQLNHCVIGVQVQSCPPWFVCSTRSEILWSLYQHLFAADEVWYVWKKTNKFSTPSCNNHRKRRRYVNYVIIKGGGDLLIGKIKIPKLPDLLTFEKKT